ncbi:antibiotic biosynthesis monooxygenase family protein [Phenylobacterium sp.]|uniref:antibiotic biosynthesis monooxygenase family protein n=1 Tax=Phenylobacterium sp. TaxID=1871053 RepID=UPI002FC6B3DE
MSETPAIAVTPEPPYYAVIFTSTRTEGDRGYGSMADEMVRMAAAQPGFLGVESARDGVGITVSYWRDLESIALWKRVADHLAAQRQGRETWYAQYEVRIAKVERAYGFQREEV